MRLCSRSTSTALLRNMFCLTERGRGLNFKHYRHNHMATSTIKANTIKSPMDIKTQIQSGWTCPSDGFIVVTVQCTATGSSTGVYISDITTSTAVEVGSFYSISMHQNTRASVCVPVLKGHTYKTSYLSGNIYSASAY